MEGRTMYVVPFAMGPPGSALARYGVQITDHAYVAASLSLVVRTGTDVLQHLGNGGTRFVNTQHTHTTHRDSQSQCNRV
jgi:phosphoenolpyruvate carboxykinase (GTP)